MAIWRCGYVAVRLCGYSELCASRLVGGLAGNLDIFEVLAFPHFKDFDILVNHFVIILGPLWDHFGIILGSFWDHFGIILGSFWDRFGVIFESFRDHFVIILGSF